MQIIVSDYKSNASGLLSYESLIYVEMSDFEQQTDSENPQFAPARVQI
jgi:hypothetical protein